MDSSCIICLDCYNNGNHKGHKVVIKKAYGGCCDCGDDEAWKPEGFCKNHSGEAAEINLDEKMKDNFIRIADDLMYLYFRSILDRTQFRNNPYLIEIITYTIARLIKAGVEQIKLISTFFALTPSQASNNE